MTNGTSVQINPFLLSNPPSGSGTLLTGTSVRVVGCMQHIGDLIFFIGRDETSAGTAGTSSYGYEMWAFNHTQSTSASNPYLIKDIRTGAGSSLVTSSGNNCEYMFVHNNTLFFAANDGSVGTELWKSDGTSNGTVLVKDIRSGSLDGLPKRFFTIGDTLYFSARTSAAYNGIWKTNGTTSGTVQISSTCGYNFNCGFSGMVEYID